MNYDIVVDPSLIDSVPNNNHLNSIQSSLQKPHEIELELPLSLHLEPTLLSNSTSLASSSSYPSQLPSQASTSSLILQPSLALPLLDRILESNKKHQPKKKLIKQQSKVSIEASVDNVVDRTTNQILNEAVRFVTATALGVTSTSSTSTTTSNENNFNNLLLGVRTNEEEIQIEIQEGEGIEEGGNLIENSVSNDLNSFMERLVHNELRFDKGKSIVQDVNSLLDHQDGDEFDQLLSQRSLSVEPSQQQQVDQPAGEEEEESIDYGLKANGKPKKKRGRPKGKKDDPNLKLDNGKFRGRPQGTKNLKGYKADILARAYAEGSLVPPAPKKRGRPAGGKNVKKDPIHSLPVDEFGNIIQYASNGYDIEGYEHTGSHPREAEYREAIDRYGAIEVLNRYQNEQYRAVAEAAAALAHQVQEEEE